MRKGDFEYSGNWKFYDENGSIMAPADLNGRRFLKYMLEILLKIAKCLAIWLCVSIVIMLLVVGSVTPFIDMFFYTKYGDGFIESDKGIVKKCDDDRGYIIIPTGVTAAKANDRWIVAVTENLNAVYRNDSSFTAGGKQYWIVDKKAHLYEDYYHVMKTKYRDYRIVTSGLHGPLDSISFENELKKRGINLEIEKH